jgi:hypothetical protein
MPADIDTHRPDVIQFSLGEARHDAIKPDTGQISQVQTGPGVITIIGEALVKLVPAHGSSVLRARPGGSAFSTAIVCLNVNVKPAVMASPARGRLLLGRLIGSADVVRAAGLADLSIGELGSMLDSAIAAASTFGGSCADPAVAAESPDLLSSYPIPDAGGMRSLA